MSILWTFLLIIILWSIHQMIRTKWVFNRLMEHLHLTETWLEADLLTRGPYIKRAYGCMQSFNWCMWHMWIWDMDGLVKDREMWEMMNNVD